MSLLALLQEEQGGQRVATLADRLGLDRAQADQLAGMLAPAIGSAVRKRAETGETEAVARTLRGTAQAGYFERPEQAAEPEGLSQGAAFLDEILGSASARDGLARAASERAGIDLSTVMQFLPALAAMLQGAMQQRMPDDSLSELTAGRAGGGAGAPGGGGLMDMVGDMLRGAGGGQAGGGGGAMDMLTRMLDSDNDGSMLDDVLEGFLSPRR